MTQASFPSDPACVRAARHFARDALGGERVTADQRATAELIVSELATNAVRHAATAFTVDVDVEGDTIRIAVTDGGPGTPEPAAPAADAPGGRGLIIVGHMADRWGVDRQPGSKTVWCTLAAGALAPSTRPSAANAEHRSVDRRPG